MCTSCFAHALILFCCRRRTGTKRFVFARSIDISDATMFATHATNSQYRFTKTKNKCLVPHKFKLRHVLLSQKYWNHRAAWMTHMCAFVFVWFGNLTHKAASCATSTKLQKACNVRFVLSVAFMYLFVNSRITDFTGFRSCTLLFPLSRTLGLASHNLLVFDCFARFKNLPNWCRL